MSKPAVVCFFDKYAASKGGALYTCQWLYPFTLRCGKCHRGILTKKVSDNRVGVISKCKVCKSKIVRMA